MLYTPVPGTPLYTKHQAEGSLLDPEECSDADSHGQFKFNFTHPHIKNGQESGWLVKAFRRDFKVNGPSIARVIRTTLQGWKRYKSHPIRRIRDRNRPFHQEFCSVSRSGKEAGGIRQVEKLDANLNEKSVVARGTGAGGHRGRCWCPALDVAALLRLACRNPC